MKRISVVLASSQGFSNTGMFTVDYAAYTFFKKNYPDCQLDFIVPHLSSESEYRYSQFIPYSTYNRMSHTNYDSFINSDMIVYWGDFLHTWTYLKGYLFKEIAKSESEKELFLKYLFLKGCDKGTLSKVIMFGSSLVPLKGKHFTDHEYSKCFKSFFDNIYYSMPRDAVSHNKLRLNSDSRIILGCDPAFLIKPSAVFLRQEKLGLFIGRRTNIRIKDIITIFSFAYHAGFKISWVDWMPGKLNFCSKIKKDKRQFKNLIFHYLLSKIFKDNTVNITRIDELQKFNIVITDTYHLALNSIRQNTPAFCIDYDEEMYSGANSSQGAEGKRRILYEMYNLDRYHGKPQVARLIDLVYHPNDFHDHEKNIQVIEYRLLQKCNNIIYGGNNADF